MPVPPPPEAQLVFDGALAKAYQWPQKMFDGSERIFECYVRPDTVTVIPFLDRNTVLLTKQEQPARQSFWDFPGGRVDPGETLDEAVKREFQEETDYVAADWLMLRNKRFSGLVRYEQALYLAKGLEKLPSLGHEQDGEKIEVIPTSWDEVVQRCLKMELRQEGVMLAVLAMHFDPEQRAKLDEFLK